MRLSQVKSMAFGSVLYEILSGLAACGGDTVRDSIATVLERDWSALPEATPAPLRTAPASVSSASPESGHA